MLSESDHEGLRLQQQRPMATYSGESEASLCIMCIIFACIGASRLYRAAAQLQGREDNNNFYCKMPIIWGSHFLLGGVISSLG